MSEVLEFSRDVVHSGGWKPGPPGTSSLAGVSDRRQRDGGGRGVTCPDSSSEIGARSTGTAWTWLPLGAGAEGHRERGTCGFLLLLPASPSTAHVRLLDICTPCGRDRFGALVNKGPGGCG